MFEIDGNYLYEDRDQNVICDLIGLKKKTNKADS